MEERVRKLEEQVAFLTSILQGLREPSQLDPDMQTGLSLALGSFVTDSSKAANAENQGVNEAGASTYNVLGPPDGFKLIDGVSVPYYN